MTSGSLMNYYTDEMNDAANENSSNNYKDKQQQDSNK